MKTLEDVTAIAKRQLAQFGRLHPTIVIEGTRASETAPLPDAPEAIKLSLLEGLGFTLAAERRIGDLVQLFLVSEGWVSRNAAPHPALQPRHDPERIETVMACSYQVNDDAQQMALYSLIRDESGELTELRALPLASTGTAESPPLEAIARGFKRGEAVGLSGR